MKYKIGVVGSRTFTDSKKLTEILDKHKEKISLIVSGGASGADTLAEEYADKNGIPKKIFYADWDKYGKSAGPRRNKKIVEASDGIVAFWDGKSKGTLNTINFAKTEKKSLLIIRV